MISELVRNIPEFLLYVVPGYLFLLIYQFMLFKDEDIASKTSHHLLNSLIASFVIKSIFDFIINAVSSLNRFVFQSYYLVLILIFSVCLGYLAARFSPSKAAWKLCNLLGIKRTVNENIWNDTIQDDMWVRVWLRSENISYYGQIKYRENFNREPLIVLEYYQILDEYSKPIVDNTNDKKRSVLLNLSQFERIEIVER